MLLLTRPKLASERFAAQFRTRYGADWPVMIAPMMRTVWLHPNVDVDGADGVIFTSETAVDAFRRLNLNAPLRAWCVGPRTAEAATGAGFNVVQGPGDAPALVQEILAEGSSARLLYVHGIDVAHNIESMLSMAGLEVVSVAAYDQQPVGLTTETRDLLCSDRPIILPLFSRRSARLFAKEVGNCVAPLWIAALSAGVAEVANGLKPTKLLVAERPDGEAMLEVLRYFVIPASLG